MLLSMSSTIQFKCMYFDEPLIYIFFLAEHEKTNVCNKNLTIKTIRDKLK